MGGKLFISQTDSPKRIFSHLAYDIIDLSLNILGKLLYLSGVAVEPLMTGGENKFGGSFDEDVCRVLVIYNGGHAFSRRVERHLHFYVVFALQLLTLHSHLLEEFQYGNFSRRTFFLWL